MSHVLLTDDPLRKQQMTLALLMHDAPELAPSIARGVLDVLGEVALYKSFEQAYAGIVKLGPASLNPKDVEDALAAAKNSWTTAKTGFSQKCYPSVLSPAFAAHEALVKAYALCQRPRTGEFRAVWNHTGTGVWPGDWPRSARDLKGSGFGAVFPNMLDGGRAHYPSKLLPRSDEFRRYGDQVAQCLAACRSAGCRSVPGSGLRANRFRSTGSSSRFLKRGNKKWAALYCLTMIVIFWRFCPCWPGVSRRPGAFNGETIG